MTNSNWQTRKISDVLERIVDPVDVKPNNLYQEIGIRSHGKGIFHKEYVTGRTLGNKRVFHIHPDCFVVNIVFAWEQAVAKTTSDEVGMIASHRFPTYRPKNNQCNVDFLIYFFKTKKGKYLLELASPGGAGRNKTLGQKEFGKLSFPMPKQSVQSQIVNILSTWDKAIDVTDKLIENSQAQKKALMQQLLSGKVRLEGFHEEWEEEILTEIAYITMGSSPKSSAYNENNLGLPLLQGNADIKNRLSKPRVYTSEITKECLIGDILLSVRAPVGVIAKSVHHACIGRGLCSIRANKNILQNYLHQWLLWFEPKWQSLSQGSTFDSVNSNDIKKLKLLFPQNKKEQKQVATILFAAGKEIELLQQELDFLKQEKKALMQQLLTGKRRIKVDEPEQ